MKRYWWIVRLGNSFHIIEAGIMVGIVERSVGPFWIWGEAKAMLDYWIK